MSADNIRDEVNRGGRLVIYMYCVSVVFMTFKRPADIRLIKAGHSPAAASWPWVLVSALLGWWGIPWGPIYTIECLYRNLSGGVDVTDDVLRSLAPASAAPAAATTTAAAPSLVTPPAPPRGFNYRVAGLMLGGACAIVLAGISLYCYQEQRNLTVVLASGLAEPYTVVVNGESHKLGPYDAKVLALPEGDITVADAPGGRKVAGRQTFHFATPFFDHLGNRQVAIINPDGAAVLLVNDVPYYNKSTTPPAHEEPAYRVLANQTSYFLPKPDYVIEAAEENISMPSGTTRLVKTRLENVRDADLGALVNVLEQKNGYEAARDYLMILGRQRTDEDLLRVAVDTLKPADLRPFFQLHLAERPLPVEWHRYYQRAMEAKVPGQDVLAEYRGYLKAEPGNGALAYLLGRLTSDEDEAQRLWQQAISAQPPCFYAYGAIGYDAMSDGRFDEALAGYDAAVKADTGASTRKAYRRQALWALGRADDILAELAAEHKADPLDLGIVEEEIRATLAFRHDEAAARKLQSDYLAAYRATHARAEHIAEADSYLQAAIAYQQGDLPHFSRAVAGIDSPYWKFAGACSQGSLKAAGDLLEAKGSPNSLEQLLLYVLARRTTNPAAAEAHFQKAVAILRTETSKHRRLADLVTAPTPDPAAICGVHVSLEEKRVLLTALGLRDPAHRETYFALARKLNFEPTFPHLFLAAAMADPI